MDLINNTQSADEHWVDAELASINLGDERRNERAKKVLKDLMKNPQASVNASCDNWADTKAAYRLFDSPEVDDQKILKAHREGISKRAQNYPVLLVVQDTTELEYTNPGKTVQGAGPLNEEYRLGFHLHASVVLTTEGVALGVLDHKIWAREPGTLGLNKNNYKKIAIEKKESYRWLEQYEQACRLQEDLPGKTVINIADRESDIYELFAATKKSGVRAKYVFRGEYDRATPENAGDEEHPHTCVKVLEMLSETTPKGQVSISLQKTPKREAREALLTVYSGEVTLRPPPRAGGLVLPLLKMSVVWAREENPPAGCEPLEWILYTDLPITTFSECLTVLDYYARRFGIEVYFRTLKTGCKVEEIQLETASRLLPCLAFYEIIAWRVMYVTYLGRECGEIPCDVIFAPEEWKSVYKVTTRKDPPSAAPRLSDFLILLAQLGGYNGRKSDGPPGPGAIWMGMRRCFDFAAAWLLFGPEAREPT